MRLTDKAIEKIDRAYAENRKESRYKTGLGLNVQNSISGATVFRDNWALCDLENLEQMIYELTMMRNTIKEEVGIY